MGATNVQFDGFDAPDEGEDAIDEAGCELMRQVVCNLRSDYQAYPVNCR